MIKGIRVNGIGISNGKVSGKIKFLGNKSVKEQKEAAVNRESELKRLREAQRIAHGEIKALEEKALSTLGQSEAQIFEIHAMILEDEDFIDSIVSEINEGKSAIMAVELAAKSYTDVLSALGDEYLSARAADIKDVSSLLIRILAGEVSINQANDSEPYILVASDLTPSETVRLDASKIIGFITFGGTPSSHTAILARAMGIPALVGTGIISTDLDGKFALLNAEKGMVVISPSSEELEAFEKEQQEYNKIAKEHESYLRSVMNKPAVSGGGHKVMIYANIGDEDEVASALSNGAEGIGLLRSEFLYLSKKKYPKEEELFSAYRDIAIKMQGKRVIVRTLDVGADKQISYFNIP